MSETPKRPLSLSAATVAEDADIIILDGAEGLRKMTVAAFKAQLAESFAAAPETFSPASPVLGGVVKTKTAEAPGVTPIVYSAVEIDARIGISPMAYGAVGDGVTNDTAALQAAFSATISASVGGQVNLGNRTYLIDDTITITNSFQSAWRKRIDIVGGGSIVQTNPTKAAIKITNSWVRLSNIALRHSDPSNTADAVQIDTSFQGVIEGVGVDGFNGAAFRFMGVACHTFTIRNNFSNNQRAGVLVDPTTQLLSAKIYGNEFRAVSPLNDCAGIEMTQFINVQSWGNTIENLKRGIWLHGSAVAAWGFTSISDHFEAIDYYPFDLCDAGEIRGLAIQYPYFSVDHGTGGTGEAIKATGTAGAYRILNLFILGCTLTPDTGNLLNLENLSASFSGGLIMLGAGDDKTADLKMPIGYSGIRVMTGNEVISPETFGSTVTINGACILGAGGRLITGTVNAVESLIVRASTDKNLVLQSSGAVVAATIDVSGSFAVGTAIPSAPTKAALEVGSTNKGFLLPRLTKSARNAISTPPNGLLIYQTDNSPGIRSYENGAWVKPTVTADP